jgi:hypothetical protein
MSYKNSRKKRKEKKSPSGASRTRDIQVLKFTLQPDAINQLDDRGFDWFDLK